MILVVGALGAFLAYAVGGLVGFASSLLFLPVLLLLDVPLVDAVTLNLVLAILTRLPSVIVLRADIDVRRTATMLVGSLPGIAVGLAVGAVVAQHALEVAAGVLVLASGGYLLVARSATVESSTVTGSTTLLAGACSGLMGVTTSLNGIPPAVLLARSGASVRTRLADLSVFFAIGNCLTLAALSLTRDIAFVPASANTFGWLLAGVAGNAVGVRLAGFLDVRRFDALTIALVLLSGLASLAGAFIG